MALKAVPHATSRALFVRLSGSLVGGSADTRVLRYAVSVMPAAGLVVFDLRQVQILTAGGVRTLIDYARTLDSHGMRCCLLAASGTAAALAATALPAFLPLLDADAIPAVAGISAPPGPVTVGSDAVAVASLISAITDTISLADPDVARAAAGEVLQRLVQTVRATVPGADTVSVTVRDAAGLCLTAAATDATARTLDRVQHDIEQGPCPDPGTRDGTGVTAYNLTDDTAWPGFTSAAIERGITAVLSTRLPAADPGATIGSLNIYSCRPHGFDDRARNQAMMLAALAALAVTSATAADDAARRVAQWQRAVETRDVIGQAKGILMARQHISADEAFDLLRRTSQDLNMKLADLARTLATNPDGLDTPATADVG
ncbi:ANTAR domain-containing protein [Nocardia sp. BMG111209]|uniref:ANTAR domain-containing protein n=1 Tax=Nocardia sp. BMG111209 TaxID=1160137 RepID=UPI0003A2474C|nr:ANTAR domain-containing protein [Nocardia sp. BMG111209]